MNVKPKAHSHRPTVIVDGRVFDFPSDWQVFNYDKWPLHSQLSGGAVKAKGCDVVALDATGETLYLIEVKDYAHPSVKQLPEKLPDIIVQKGFDTLGGIFAGAKMGESYSGFCQRALQCRDLILALCIELPDNLPEPQTTSYILNYLREKITAGARYLTAPALVELTSSLNTPWQCRMNAPTTASTQIVSLNA